MEGLIRGPSESYKMDSKMVGDMQADDVPKVRAKSLGLSDIPENVQKEARKVLFAVGDLTYLDETR